MNNRPLVRHLQSTIPEFPANGLDENSVCSFRGGEDIMTLGANFPVDSAIKSRHTANGILKQAGLPKAF